MGATSTPQMPADVRELLDRDPRVEAFAPAPAGHPYREVLKAQAAPSQPDARFAKLSLFNEDPFFESKWLNKPAGVSAKIGRGKGFSSLGEQPVIEEDGPRPGQRADVFRHGAWTVVSSLFDDIVRRFDAGAIDSIPVEWRFSDGRRHEGARFLDITRQFDAYDYRHSQVRLYIEHDRRSVCGLDFPRVLKPGIAPDVHLFRDSWLRSEILLSIELARALANAGMRGFTADDLQTGRPIPLGYRD